MAKMFYTMDEAAEKLGVDTAKVKEMAEAGQLNQFRDRDKVMFKVDQIDKLAAERGGGGEAEGGAAGGAGEAGESGELELSEPSSSEDTDAIDLASEVEADHDKEQKSTTDRRSETGVSVFDADEVDAADPMAQTVVSDSPPSDEDELALESVGSGSGLLDLTRESDDTSLGAELLEEIYPSSGSAEAGESQGGEMQGIFESGGAEGGEAELGELESSGEPQGAAASGAAMAVVEAEPRDPAGSGWTAGLLIGALVALAAGSLVMVSTLNGVQVPLLDALAGNLPMYAGALAAGSLVLGIIGGLIGKAVGR